MYQRIIGGFTVAMLALIAALLAAVYTELRQVRDNTAGGGHHVPARRRAVSS